MDEIYTLHYNSFGIAFKWKRSPSRDLNKVQLVFRDTGLYLTFKELTCFSKLIEKTLSKPLMCTNCKNNKSCRSILMETPLPQVSFVMTHHELFEMQDLIEGTLFQLGLNDVLEKQVIKRNI